VAMQVGPGERRVVRNRGRVFAHRPLRSQFLPPAMSHSGDVSALHQGKR
jgi:hypothetical protein